MGYTHYWTHQEKLDPQSVGRAVIDMAKVVEAKADLLGDGLGEGKPEIAEGMICFNGVGDDSYETFSFPGGWSNDGAGEGFNFCKTARRPYDPVVTACLAIAKDRMGESIDVSSDGDREEWSEGVALACQATGREIANPIE